MGFPTTTIVQVAVSEFPLESTTLEVKVYVPAVVVLPLCGPRVQADARGRVPETIENVYGAVPPVTPRAEV